MLASLVLLLFFLYPLVGTYGDPGILLNVFVLITFLVSLRAIASNQRMVRVLILLALPMFAARIWASVSPDTMSLVVYSVLNTLFLVAVLITCLTRVLDQSPVNEDKIMGALCVYILIGVIFSFVYEITYIFDPNSIDLGTEFAASVDPQQFWVFTYFSFVTLTTLGYGDVLPVAPFARSMATLEAVLGPLYLAILIARLVSLADLTSPAARPSKDPNRPADT